MSFIGTGDQDWVELDLDLFDRQRLSRLRGLLEEDHDQVARAICNDYEVEVDDGGTAFLLVEGVRRFVAEVNHDDRLLLTSILDPEGPL